MPSGQGQSPVRGFHPCWKYLAGCAARGACPQRSPGCLSGQTKTSGCRSRHQALAAKRRCRYFFASCPSSSPRNLTRKSSGRRAGAADFCVRHLAFVLRNVSMFAIHAKLKARSPASPCNIILMPIAVRFLALFTGSLFRIKLIMVFHVVSSTRLTRQSSGTGQKRPAPDFMRYAPASRSEALRCSRPSFALRTLIYDSQCIAMTVSSFAALVTR